MSGTRSVMVAAVVMGFCTLLLAAGSGHASGDERHEREDRREREYRDDDYDGERHEEEYEREDERREGEEHAPYYRDDDGYDYRDRDDDGRRYRHERDDRS